MWTCQTVPLVDVGSGHAEGTGITIIPQACIVRMHERVNERSVGSTESKQACERKTTISVSDIGNNDTNDQGWKVRFVTVHEDIIDDSFNEIVIAPRSVAQ